MAAAFVVRGCMPLPAVIGLLEFEKFTLLAIVMILA